MGETEEGGGEKEGGVSGGSQKEKLGGEILGTEVPLKQLQPSLVLAIRCVVDLEPINSIRAVLAFRDNSFKIMFAGPSLFRAGLRRRPGSSAPSPSKSPAEPSPATPILRTTNPDLGTASRDHFDRGQPHVVRCFGSLLRFRILGWNRRARDLNLVTHMRGQIGG